MELENNKAARYNNRPDTGKRKIWKIKIENNLFFHRH
jgi:hypothetical protein